jgi:hypothetical protein
MDPSCILDLTVLGVCRENGMRESESATDFIKRLGAERRLICQELELKEPRDSVFDAVKRLNRELKDARGYLPDDLHLYRLDAVIHELCTRVAHYKGDSDEADRCRVEVEHTTDTFLGALLDGDQTNCRGTNIDRALAQTRDLKAKLLKAEEQLAQCQANWKIEHEARLQADHGPCILLADLEPALNAWQANREDAEHLAHVVSHYGDKALDREKE